MVILFELFLVLLPLLFSMEASQHFELPKFAFVLFFIGILGGAFAYDVIVHKRDVPLVGKEKRMLYGILWVIVLFLSWQTYVSVSPSTSFWGSYERHQGLVLYTAGFYLFLHLTFVSYGVEHIRRILRALLGGGFLVSLTALWQYVAPHIGQGLFDFGSTSNTLGRVYGTMGHPNFLGQFLLVTLLVHLYFFIEQKKASLRWTWFLSLSFFVQVLVLFLSGNRASILAFFLSMLCFFLYQYQDFFLKRWKKAVLAFLITLLLILVPFFYWFERLGEGGFIRSLQTRFMLVPSVVELIAHRPFMGYGLDSFSYVFSPYFPRGMGETESYMHMPDRAHNIVLDSLVEKGVLGMLLELCFLVFLCVLLKKRWKKADVHQRALLLLSSSVLLFQYISFLGGFPTISDTILRWILLGILCSQIPEQEVQGEKRSAGVGTVPFFALSVVMIPFFLYSSIVTYRSDVLYARAKDSSSQSQYLEALKNAPSLSEYLIFGSDLLTDTHDKIRFLKHAQQLNPQDYFIQIQLLRAYALLKEKDAMQSALNRAQILCPNCPLVYVYGGEAFERVEEKELARSLMQKYVDLAPSYVQSYLRGEEGLLSTYEKERLRIFLKENEEYFSYVVKTLGLQQQK